MHAKIKYAELYLMLSLMYVKKNHQFLSSIGKDAQKRKLVPFFWVAVYNYVRVSCHMLIHFHVHVFAYTSLVHKKLV